MKEKDPIRFYGYKHWTLEDPSRCFYVGKGVKGRAHSKDRGKKWHAIVKRLGLRVEECVGPMSETRAFIWEIQHIPLMSTRSYNYHHNDDADIGCNFTDGGDGRSGYLPLPLTETARANIREAALRRPPVSEETRTKMKAANRPPITEEMRAKHLECCRTDESRAKRRMSALRRPPHSEETKVKIGIKSKEYRHPEETKEKLRGPKSPEHKANLRRSWAKRKHDGWTDIKRNATLKMKSVVRSFVMTLSGISTKEYVNVVGLCRVRRCKPKCS